jgi:tetratricopeptide (TPR) repeat protein
MSDDASGTSGARRWWRRPPGLLVLALGLGFAAWAVAALWAGRRRQPEAPHVQAAHRAWSAGRLEEAAAALTRARDAGEPAAEVDRIWGLVYDRAGRPEDALPLLRRAWDQPGGGRRRGDPEVAEALARIAMERFELADAIAVLDRWAGEVPTDPKPLLWRARVDRRIGASPAAIVGRYREALRRDPTSDAAQLGLADVLYREGRYAESAELYAAYPVRHPDELAGQLGVGIAARAQGQLEPAAGALDRALALAPDDTLALKERAAIDLLQGHPDVALRRLDRAINADPFDPELHYQRSRVLSRLGRRDEAAADLRRSEQLRREHVEMARISTALTEQPTDNTLHCRAARWMLAHGRSEEGAQWARLVLRDQPDHPEANRLLADYHRGRGELGLANFYQMHIPSAPAAENRLGPDLPTGPPSTVSPSPASNAPGSPPTAPRSSDRPGDAR